MILRSAPRIDFLITDIGLPAFFAGLWTRWTSIRKVKEGETINDLFGFLTTAPNAEVKATHPKAMPVILTTNTKFETWLAAPIGQALALRRSLPDGVLKIVARGDRTRDAAPG
jgi:putative SOS response-associated peptidase YedK